MQKVLLFAFLLFSFCVDAETLERVVWKSDVPREEYARLIKVRVGEPLSLKAVRRTVRLLYATGRFEQVIVLLSPGTTPDKVILTIGANPLLFVDDIVITGNRALSDNRIKLAGGIHRFVPIYESSLERIREEILFTYRSEGYPDAAVSIEVRRTSPSTADLAISVREGERRHIARIVLTGEVLPSEKRELENALTLSNAFSPLTNEHIRTIGEHAETYFHSRGYLNASVKTATHADGSVVLTVTKGHRYLLFFKGNLSFSEKTLREVVTFIEQWYHRSADIIDRLTRFYHAAGFPDVTVSVTIKENSLSSETILSVTIEEGERRFLDGVVFSGVVGGDPEKIKQRIFSFVENRFEEEAFPQHSLNRTFAGGGYRDTDGSRCTMLARTNRDRVILPGALYAIPAAYLDSIGRDIELWYTSRGFLQAKVERVAFVREKDLFFLDVSLREGPRTMLTWVGFQSGNPSLDEEIASELDIAANVPFDPAIVGQTVVRLEEMVRARGYFFARVRAEQAINDNNTEMRLTFIVEDLFPVRVGELVVSGNAVTDESVVRNLARFDTGTLLTTKLLHDARQNLLATGSFDAVEVAIIDEGNPATEKDISISITEAWRFRFSIGAGVATDEGGHLFGSFEYKNMFGRIFALHLSYMFGYKIPFFMGDNFRTYFLREIAPLERLDRRVNGAFIIPDLYALPFSLGFQSEVFHIHDSRVASGLPYLLDKNGLTVSLYKRFGDHFFLSVTTEVSRQDEEIFHADYPEEEQLDRRGRYLLAPEIEGWTDYRDNPVIPNKGFKIGIRTRNVTSLAGAKVNYTILENFASVYLPLQYRKTVSGDYEPRDTLIWHSFLKYAVLFLHSGTLTAEDALKLGGSTTVRGFGQNSIIPNDDTNGVPEGRYEVFLRNEMRLKVYDRLYLVAFFDAGNLWEHIENIGKGDLFRYGTGGGLMFASPIGSINLQAGLNLFPREDVSHTYREDIWRFHLFISSF